MSLAEKMCVIATNRLPHLVDEEYAKILAHIKTLAYQGIFEHSLYTSEPSIIERLEADGFMVKLLNPDIEHYYKIEWRQND